MGKSKRHIKTIDGLSERHVAQIIRRKMIQKSEPHSKAYKRQRYYYDSDDE